MDDTEIEKFVCNWLRKNAHHVESWNYDENLSRSIDIFHVHVYLCSKVLTSISSVAAAFSDGKQAEVSKSVLEK
ncbi:hypothetical protein JG687_00009140 [Phytophthora cactorum]|uniref:Uncharacterized protein n=2 Tax=Phytophthora TaxID=4783 RepID=A0A8J5MFA3_9STRA|nr:hypothetical protein JG688_00010918 [Phytophthora aleatoria]KAG6958839.1 hypothetical protein JG687_00009140 [Phytophthora cactorum]